MREQAHKRVNGHARPVRSKRDYLGATAVVKRLAAQPSRETDAELRLQSLIRELDKYEAADDEAAADSSGSEDYSGPHRRWSDDS